MITPILSLILVTQTAPHVDTAAVYEAVLREIRAENAGLPVVLSETRSGVACMPHCGADLREADAEPVPEPIQAETHHSEALLRTLRSRGLIDETCPVAERTFGCVEHPGHLFVGLGEVSGRPPGGPPQVENAVWVKAALLVPCRTGCRPRKGSEPYFPDAYGIWFLLRPEAEGRWTILRRMVAFQV